MCIPCNKANTLVAHPTGHPLLWACWYAMPMHKSWFNYFPCHQKRHKKKKNVNKKWKCFHQSTSLESHRDHGHPSHPPRRQWSRVCLKYIKRGKAPYLGRKKVINSRESTQNYPLQMMDLVYGDRSLESTVKPHPRFCFKKKKKKILCGAIWPK